MEDAVLSSVNQHFEEKDGIASHKSLSIAYGWGLAESQLNLERYIERHTEVKPVFRISGFQCMNDDQWSYVVRLTTSNGLAAHRDLKEFKKHVYSIHKNETTNVDALACFNKSLAHDPVSHPSLVSFPWKYAPPTSSNPAKVMKIANPVPSPVKSQSRMDPMTQKTSVPSVPTVAHRKSVKRPPPKSRLHKPEKVPEKVEDIPDPFADSDEDVLEEEAELMHKKRRRLVFSSDEEGEVKAKKTVESNAESCSSNGGAKIKIDRPSKSVSKISASASKANDKSPQKRKSSKRSNSEKKELISDDDDHDGEEAIKLSPAKGVKKKSSKVAISKVKEDSDEEMFELAPAQGVKKENSPPPPPPCPVSTTRKRQVTKTFTDDDGFLITEKVWEEVDESELQVEETEPPKPETAVETKKAPSSVTNMANSKLKKTKQSTLMSFFRK